MSDVQRITQGRSRLNSPANKRDGQQELSVNEHDLMDPFVHRMRAMAKTRNHTQNERITTGGNEMKTKKADIFDVWGTPPQALTSEMSKQQIAALRRYTEMVADKSYRLAYDNGSVHAFCLIAATANEQLRKQRESMRRTTIDA